MFGGFGIIILIGLFIWSYMDRGRVLPSALIAAYFGLSALAMLSGGGASLWLILYAMFAFMSGRRALSMKRAGYPW